MPVPVAAEAKEGDVKPEGVTAAKEDHDWVLGDSEDPAVTELVSEGHKGRCLLAALYAEIIASSVEKINEPTFCR